MSSTDSGEISLRINDVVQDSVVDGPGLRFAVFFQGCPHACPGCHNPRTHDVNGGRLTTVSALMRQIDKNPILQGVTLSGGEPFLQAAQAAALAREARVRGMDVWCYTGMTWEQLTSPDTSGAHKELLSELDVLVDGPFILSQRTLDLNWRGSRNQRVIDVKASLSGDSIVEWEED